MCSEHGLSVARNDLHGYMRCHNLASFLVLWNRTVEKVGRESHGDDTVLVHLRGLYSHKHLTFKQIF